MSSTSSQTQVGLDQQLRETLIRDLVETYPAAMPVLSEYGFDLCCGGAHTIPAAAEAHGLNGDEIVKRVRGAIETERSE